MFKVDLHTHSSASPDGSIRPEQYEYMLEQGLLDCIAITDHNTIDLALSLHKKHKNKIIVGEEITTSLGEIIGLYLREPVAPMQTPLETVKAIKKQGGLVYIPHPFETVRQGLNETTMDEIATSIDIVEVHNGRAVFQNRSMRAITWTRLNRKHWAASSDAHGQKGLCTTYTTLEQLPTRETLLPLLSKGQLVVARPPLKTLLYPKYNRFRKRFQR